VVGSWYLTGESNVFGVLPTVEHPFRFDGSGWGAWQLAARFGQLSLDPNSMAALCSAWFRAGRDLLERRHELVFESQRQMHL
jgi:phosphate-selective porin